MNPLPDLPAEIPLTERERRIVATIADRERAADPAFARRLTGGKPPRHRAAVALAALAALGVALLVLPGVWVVALVAVTVLVAVPTVLVAWALRQGHRPPD